MLVAARAGATTDADNIIVKTNIDKLFLILMEDSFQSTKVDELNSSATAPPA